MHPRHDDSCYLEYIREQPCARCGRPAPSDPHHLVSRKTGNVDRNDYNTVPLCRPCHNLTEAPFWTLARWLEDRKLPEVWLAETVAELLVTYFRRTPGDWKI